MQNRGSISISSVLAVVGLVGLGIGGFNFARTGCPLGSCGASANATLVNVADKAEKSESCCPLHTGAVVETVAVEKKEGCCGGAAVGTENCCGGCSTTDGAVTPVANAEACVAKTDCGSKSECSEADKAGCEGDKAGLTPVNNDAATSDCAEKSGCESKSACPAQTADAAKNTEKTSG